MCLKSKKYNKMFTSKFISLIMVGAVAISCTRENQPDPDPEMSSSSDLICKFDSPLKGETPGPNKTCVFWEYNEEGSFTMTHYNAGFNCEPGEILTSMKISGDTIYISERDLTHEARCNCLFNVDFVIQNLKAGQYVVKFDEPFVVDPKEPLVFTVDLEEDSEGQVCQYRDYYPWRE